MKEGKEKTVIDPKDYDSSVNQKIKEKFVEREIYCNVSSMMEYCLKTIPTTDDNRNGESPFTIDDIENLYQDVCPKCGSANIRDPKENEELFVCNDCEEQFEDYDLRQQEVFEWWAVSEYLYRKLQNHGEVVVDTGSCYVWGRTTTGQAILLDGVISEICVEMEIFEGQQYAWEKKDAK